MGIEKAVTSLCDLYYGKAPAPATTRAAGAFFGEKGIAFMTNGDLQIGDTVSLKVVWPNGSEIFCNAARVVAVDSGERRWVAILLRDFTPESRAKVVQEIQTHLVPAEGQTLANSAAVCGDVLKTVTLEKIRVVGKMLDDAETEAQVRVLSGQPWAEGLPPTGGGDEVTHLEGSKRPTVVITGAVPVGPVEPGVRPEDKETVAPVGTAQPSSSELPPFPPPEPALGAAPDEVVASESKTGATVVVKPPPPAEKPVGEAAGATGNENPVNRLAEEINQLGGGTGGGGKEPPRDRERSKNRRWPWIVAILVAFLLGNCSSCVAVHFWAAPREVRLAVEEGGTIRPFSLELPYGTDENGENPLFTSVLPSCASEVWGEIVCPSTVQDDPVHYAIGDSWTRMSSGAGGVCTASQGEADCESYPFDQETATKETCQKLSDRAAACWKEFKKHAKPARRPASTEKEKKEPKASTPTRCDPYEEFTFRKSTGDLDEVWEQGVAFKRACMLCLGKEEVCDTECQKAERKYGGKELFTTALHAKKFSDGCRAGGK